MKNSRFIKSISLLLSALLLFCACGGKTERTALELASVAAEGCRGELSLKLALPGEEAYLSYVSGLYGIGEEYLEDGAVLAAGGSEAFEIAVLKLSSKADAKEVQSCLEEYISGRTASFAGYFPEQEEILKRSRAKVKKGFALLFICEDPSAAEKAFDTCFSSKEVPAVPEYPSMDGEGQDGEDGQFDPSWFYSKERLLSAWEKGDFSGLHMKDRAILSACRELIGQASREGQSLPELELAVHDLLIDRMEYDTATLENYGGTPDPDNDNPYGALIGGKGICEGYTRTFQLLMDICGIECISVYGNSNNGREYGEHAWNQVRLDGEWYVVDVTWDDPLSSGTVSAKSHHRYFNVTSKYISDRHFWDTDAVPDAAGELYTWEYVRKMNSGPGH